MECTINSLNTDLTNEIKKIICKLPDILQCNVVCDSESVIKEIHVLAMIGKNIKQLVRDIQSAVKAMFGLDIDYKIISVAQINSNDIRHTTVKLDGLSVNKIENCIEANVILTCESRSFTGRSIKVKSITNKYKAIAEATILALESFQNIKDMYYIEGIEKVIIAGKEIITAVIGFSCEDKEETFVGSSTVEPDENEAVIKAVLAALGKKINMELQSNFYREKTT